MKTKIVKRGELMDPKSGEIVETITILPSSDDRVPYTKVYRLFASKVLEDLGTMNVEAKVLLWMLSQRAMMPIQASGFIDCPQEMLAYAIGCKRLAVNKAMKNLREKGYIEQRRPKSQTWRIRPDLCFRGSLNNYWKNTQVSPDGAVDVWSPWSQEDFARMKAGEQPLFEHDQLPPAEAV